MEELPFLRESIIVVQEDVVINFLVQICDIELELGGYEITCPYLEIADLRTFTIEDVSLKQVA